MTRGAQLPEEVHWIVVRLGSIYKPAEVAVLTGVRKRTVQHILKYFDEHRTVEPATRKAEAASSEPRRRRTVLDEWERHFLISMVRQNPDLYLDELQNLFLSYSRKNVHISTIWRVLKRAGYTLKKLTKVAAERSYEKRMDFLARISQYDPHQLIFVDESSVDRRTTYRTRARAPRGMPATRKAFFVRGKRFSVLPALSLSEGILHCDVIKGSFCTESYHNFISGVLDKMQPYPGPNSVLVMDNCKIHKHPSIQEMIVSRGMRCEFLPPYSPDFNPIELTFSAMKFHLRRNGVYVRFAMTHMEDEDIYLSILDALYRISLHDVFGWYRHCGYV